MKVAGFYIALAYFSSFINFASSINITKIEDQGSLETLGFHNLDLWSSTAMCGSLGFHGYNKTLIPKSLETSKAIWLYNNKTSLPSNVNYNNSYMNLWNTSMETSGVYSCCLAIKDAKNKATEEYYCFETTIKIGEGLYIDMDTYDHPEVSIANGWVYEFTLFPPNATSARCCLNGDPNLPNNTILQPTLNDPNGTYSSWQVDLKIDEATPKNLGVYNCSAFVADGADRGFHIKTFNLTKGEPKNWCNKSLTVARDAVATTTTMMTTTTTKKAGRISLDIRLLFLLLIFFEIGQFSNTNK